MKEFLQNIKVKIILCITLLVISGVMLFFYFRTPVIEKTDKLSEKPARTFTSDDIRNMVPRDIDTMLFTYGIRKEWIKDESKTTVTDHKTKKKDGIKEIKNKPANAELLFQKDINIPYDISTIDLTADLSILFKYYGLSEIVNEDPHKKDINIDLSIASDSLKKNIGNVRLLYNDKIKREAADVCIIINNLNEYDIKDAEPVLSSPESFSVVLPLNLERSDLQALINETKRDYIIHITLGNMDDIDVDMKSDGREKDWKMKIKGFSNEFSKTSGIIIDNKHKDKIFEDKVFDEILKNKLTPYKDSVLIKFQTKEKGPKAVNELFTNILSRTSGGKTTQVYLVNFTKDEFNYFDKQVHNLKKRGYKFLNFKDIMHKVSSAVVKDQSEDIKKGNTAEKPK